MYKVKEMGWKKIIIIIFLIVIVGVSLFLIFRKEKVFILYIEGLDREIFNQYSVEQLPNLKKLYLANLDSEISLNSESSFLTILSGKYKYGSNDDKNPAEYSVTKKKSDNLGLFYQTDLYQQAKKNELRSKFFNQKIDLENVNFNLVICKYQVEDNNLEEYQKIDDIIKELVESFNWLRGKRRIIVIAPQSFQKIENINQILVNKGFLACPDGLQSDLLECDLANSFAYSPASGEIYVNQKDREKLGRVDWDLQGVINDTVYVLSLAEENNDNYFQIYKGQEYFKQENFPEILIFENQEKNKGLMLSNKKFVQREYNYLEILGLIFND
jgi:hypothetical protein